MDAKGQSKKVFANVGDKIPWRCGQCNSEAGFSESVKPVTAVAKWICPNCGTLNEFEVQFKIGAG
jgi:transcription elongation factor Elf1